MNSFVNVQIRVFATQAQARLAALNAQLNGLGGSMTGAASATNQFGRAVNGLRLDALGSRIQWIGRQLEYNFTLPLIAAAAAAYKFALDNEAAFTRVIKVYGDATHSAEFYKQELQSLQGAFRALSDHFGIAQKDAINIAADWAAAGASGLALAKSVKLTLETMILGELQAADATKSLIAIQAQYGLSIDDLSKTIAVLNMVENQTGISMAGLIEGFARAAGVARSAGVDVRHLAAMLAALTPAAGSAAQAGNALKTIFSRLLSPTEETVDVLNLMGIKTDDLGWQSANLTDRLGVLATKFTELSDAQQGVVSSVVASRWQINKFEILMRELASATGYYQKALDSTADAQANFNQMQRELNTVLQSNPRRLQIIWTMLQNAAADIITPMIPLLLYLAQGIQKLVTAFSNLNPVLQKFILAGLAVFAFIGPLVRLSGAFILAFSEMGKAVKWLGGLLLWLVRSPFKLLLRAVPALAGAIAGPWGIAIGVAITLIIAFWDQIKAFATNVVKVMRAAFNALPQAVQNGLLALVRTVAAAINRIRELLSYLNPWARHSPSLVDNVTTGVAEIMRQFSLLNNVAVIFGRAGASLREFSQALYDINQATAAGELDKLRTDLLENLPGSVGQFDMLVAVLKSLRQEMTQLQASYPIEQAQAFSDAIFENQMQMKALQLQLMHMEDAVGPMDELQNRMQSINGMLELLNGERSDLRSAGAGSDILSQYDEQISALEGQKAAIEAQIKPIQDVSDQLEALRKQGDELDLEQALALDPITRQMDQLDDAIRTVESSLQAMGQAASDAAAANGRLSPGAQNFIDAAGGNFADVGGLAQIGREGGIEDQAAMIDEFTKQIAQATADAFGQFSILEPIKNAWNKAVDWLKQNIAPGIGNVGEAIKNAWNAMWADLDASGVTDKIKDAWETLKTFFEVLWDTVGPIIKEIGQVFMQFFDDLKNEIGPELAEFKDLWPDLKEAMKEAWDIAKPLVELLGGAFIVVVGILAAILKNDLKVALDLIISTLKGLIMIFRGIIEFLTGIFTGDWEMVWKGITDIVGGNMQLIVGIIKAAFGLIFGIFTGTFEGIRNFWNAIWNQISGTVDATRTRIVNTFWDMVSGVGGAIQNVIGRLEGMIGYLFGLPGRIAGAVSGAFNGLWVTFRNTMNQIIGGWNRLSFTLGGGSFLGVPIPGFTLSTPDMAFLASGGMIARDAMAIVGEGRRGYPEYVIPTDPSYRNRALQLYSQLGEKLGNQKNPAIGGGTGSEQGAGNTYNFYGDLSFPNVKDGKDVEEFLNNLEALMGGS